MSDVKGWYSRWTINRRIRREKDELRMLDEKYASCWVKEDPVQPITSAQPAEVSHKCTTRGSDVAAVASSPTSVTGPGVIKNPTSSVSQSPAVLSISPVFHMYHIVEFLETNEIAVISHAWLLGDAIAVWPTVKQPKALKFLLSHTLPPVGKFELHQVRVLKSTDNYQEAREYERKLERESEFTSNDATNIALPTYKKRNKRKRRLSSSESDLSQEVPSPRTHLNKLFTYYPMKQLNIVNSTILHADVDQSGKKNVPPVLFPSTSYASSESSNEELHHLAKRSTHRFDNQMMHLREAIKRMDERLIRMEATLNDIWSHLSC